MPITTMLDAAVPVIRLTGDIDMPVAYSLLDELNLLHGYYQFRTVDLHLDSPGGSADALQAIVHGLIPWSSGEGRVLKTFGMNEVASAAAIILSFGTVGHRTASRRSRLLYHSVRAVPRDASAHTVASLRVATKRLERWDKLFVDLLAEHTLGSNANVEAELFRARVKRLMRREKFISAEQARELKLIDGVV